jgi:cysteine-rich repeat protein
VKDNGEACDEGHSINRNNHPNKCRSDCTLPRCGDGIADTAAPYNEQCDDGNSDDSDGCLKTCKSCVKLNEVGNFEITEDTTICPNSYGIDDYGDYGVIIIKKSGVTLDCQGAELTGEGRGVGIMVFRSNDVTIKNCHLFKYETAIKGEDSSNVTLINNKMCNNSAVDIDFAGSAGGTGQGNACHSAGQWNDSGKTGCSQRIFNCNLPTVSIQVPRMNVPAAVMSAPGVGSSDSTEQKTLNSPVKGINRNLKVSPRDLKKK